MSKVTEYSSMGLAGDSGIVSQASKTNSDRLVESGLAGLFYDATLAVTTTLADVPVGGITDTKEYLVWLRNTAPAVATNIVQVEVTDGTNTIDFGVIRPDRPWGPVCMKAKSSSQPKLRVKTDTGTATIEVKVFEAGNPAV